MPRAAASFRHDDAIRADKAFRAMGMRLGRIITYQDRVEYVPNYGDSGESLNKSVDETHIDATPLPEPERKNVRLT